MALTRSSLRLTADGARRLIDAALAHAAAMSVPQCIAVVDEGCNLMAFIRMDGARVLSIRSAQRKAMTAATTGRPTGLIDAAIELKLALATDGEMVNLRGGLPIIVEGQVIGGIGVGSGHQDQDFAVANAGLAAFPHAQTFTLSSQSSA
jgi:glc operon protein GlcG